MKLSLSLKLLLGLGLLIVTMTTSISLFNKKIIEESILMRERDFNLSLIEAKEFELSTYFESLINKAATTGKLLLVSDKQEEVFRKEFSEALALEVYSTQRKRTERNFPADTKQFENSEWIEIKANATKLYQNQKSISPLFFPLSGEPSRFALVLPFSQYQDQLDQIIIASIDAARLLRYAQQTRIGKMGLISDQGHLFFQSESMDPILIALSKQIVSTAHDLPLKNYSGLHKIDKENFVYSFSKSSYGPIIFNAVSTSVLLAPAQLMFINTIEMTGYFLAGAIFLLFLFSLNLTSSLERLSEITKEIATGKFDHDLSSLMSAWVKDEVFSLTVAVDRMVKGLKERDRFKTLFNKFHGSAITDDLMKNEIALRGEKRNVFVFFSDLRGFTQMSESRDPEVVVKMLNEYFGQMVPAINDSGGVVDKFIGDAIMAVWGAPHANPEDGKNALMACLKIRAALAELNRLRIERGEEPLWMGMGLHYGEAISGTIGSEERMEYTVIGNTINTASRIEAATKSFGTDLLVSEEVQSQLTGFIYEEAGSVEVKGRSVPLKLFKVKGLVTEDENEIEVTTAYSQFEAEKADKVKVVA